MKPIQMFALMHYGRLMCVRYRRKDCKADGIDMMIGGEPEYRKMVRDGSFTIEKVEVRLATRKP